MSKGPFYKDFRGYTFFGVIACFMLVFYCCCDFLSWNEIIWKTAASTAFFVLSFACDNSGLRTGFFKLFLKKKIVFKWLQRENSYQDIVSEWLKTITYFCLVCYWIFGGTTFKVIAWVIIVILNIIMWIRRIACSELFSRDRFVEFEVQQKSILLTSIVFYITFDKISFSTKMLIITAVSVIAFAAVLFIATVLRKLKNCNVVLSIILFAVFSFCSVRCANYIFDFNEPTIYESEIISKETTEILGRRRRTMHYFVIEDWNDSKKNITHLTDALTYNTNQVGDTIKIRQGEGALGGRWYEFETLTEKRSDNGTQND